MRGGRFRGDRGRVRSFWNGGQHLFLSQHQRGGIEAGDFEAVAMGNGVGGTRFDAVAAEDAAVVVDVIDLGITLAAADALPVGVLGGFYVDAVGRAGRRAKKTGHALLHAVCVALQNVYAAVTLFQLGGTIGIIFRHRGRHHLPKCDAHSLGDSGRRIQYVFECIRHYDFSVSYAPPGSSVFRTSTGLPLRYIFVRLEGIHTHSSGHRQEFPLVEAFETRRDLSVALHPKKRGNVREAVRVTGWIAAFLAIEQEGKTDIEFGGKFLGGLGIVLRDAVNLKRSGRASAMYPLQEREYHLTHRTGGFEECQQHGPAGEQFAEIYDAALSAVFIAGKREIGRAISGAQRFAVGGGSHRISVYLAGASRRRMCANERATSARMCRAVTG